MVMLRRLYQLLSIVGPCTGKHNEYGAEAWQKKVLGRHKKHGKSSDRDAMTRRRNKDEFN